MILQGSQRGGAKDLALHLLKEDNEHVELHEMRGFVSDNLVDALNEAYAISRGTKAKQFLFSVSFNPPQGENISTQDFEKAIAKVEKHFGFENQPRAIVFHEKHGRRHAHCVWSRIDAKEMKAIPLPFTKRDLKEISKSLYLEHGWELPRGFISSQERDPTNFTLAQWQQAKRAGRDPKAIKAALQDAWALSDSKTAFQEALRERGFYLAKGDRRGFVVLDHKMEVYSLPKWTCLKTKAFRGRLGDPDTLDSVAKTKTRIASDMAKHLESLKHKQSSALEERAFLLHQKKQDLTDTHRGQRAELKAKQEERQLIEAKARQDRFNKGLRGFWDRLTGKHKKIRVENEADLLEKQNRDSVEKDQLIFKQLEKRRALQARIDRLEGFQNIQQSELAKDITQYRDIELGEQDVFECPDRPRHRGMTLER